MARVHCLSPCDLLDGSRIVFTDWRKFLFISVCGGFSFSSLYFTYRSADGTWTEPTHRRREALRIGPSSTKLLDASHVHVRLARLGTIFVYGPLFSNTAACSLPAPRFREAKTNGKTDSVSMRCCAGVALLRPFGETVRRPRVSGWLVLLMIPMIQLLNRQAGWYIARERIFSGVRSVLYGPARRRAGIRNGLSWVWIGQIYSLNFVCMCALAAVDVSTTIKRSNCYAKDITLPKLATNVGLSSSLHPLPSTLKLPSPSYNSAASQSSSQP